MNKNQLSNEQLISLLIEEIPNGKLSRGSRYYNRNVLIIPKNIKNIDFATLPQDINSLKILIKENSAFQDLCLIKIDGLAEIFSKSILSLSKNFNKVQEEIKRNEIALQKKKLIEADNKQKQAALKQKLQKRKENLQLKKIKEQEILRARRLEIRRDLRKQSKLKENKKKILIDKIGLSSEQKDLLNELL